MNKRNEFDSLWAIAESRQNSNLPAFRHIHLAYSMSPGDSEISARAWLTEEESTRLHELTLELGKNDSEGAKARIAARIAKRNKKDL